MREGAIRCLQALPGVARERRHGQSSHLEGSLRSNPRFTQKMSHMPLAFRSCFQSKSMYWSSSITRVASAQGSILPCAQQRGDK